MLGPLLRLLPPKEVRLQEEGLNHTSVPMARGVWYRTLALQTSSLALSLIFQTILMVPSLHRLLEPQNSCSSICPESAVKLGNQPKSFLPDCCFRKGLLASPGKPYSQLNFQIPLCRSQRGVTFC